MESVSRIADGTLTPTLDGSKQNKASAWGVAATLPWNWLMVNWSYCLWQTLARLGLSTGLNLPLRSLSPMCDGLK